jgi:hypothetical protein
VILQRLNGGCKMDMEKQYSISAWKPLKAEKEDEIRG